MAQTSQTTARVLQFEDYALDTASLELRRDGQKIKLAPTPTRMLAILVEHAGQLVTREELCGLLWGEATFVQYEGSLNFCVNQVRSALGDRAEEPRFIETLRGRGYRFIAPTTIGAPVANADRSRVASVVAAVAATLCVAVVLASRGDARPSTPVGDAHSVSVAVIPFQTTPNDPMQRHLGEGISDEISRSLRSLDAIRVASPVSIRSRRHEGMGELELARDLRVRALVTGSVTRAGDRVKVTARLQEAPSWRTRWEHTYERPFEDLFLIRTAISERVLGTLGIRVTPEQIEQLAKGPTESVQAYDLLLRAATYYRRYRAQDFDNAIALYRRSLEADPEYALAHATLANALIQRWLHRGQPPQARDEALRSAHRALELDPNVANAYKALGMIYHSLGRLDDSARAYERALELWPDYIAAIHNLGRLAYLRGRWAEAVRWQGRQSRLNPDHPLATSVMAETFLGLGLRSEAETLMARVAETEPRYVTMHVILARDELREGNVDAAEARLERLLDTDPGRVDVQTLAGHYFLATKQDQRAASHFRRVLELSRGHDEYARFRVASIEWRSGSRGAEVERILEEFVDMCQRAIAEGFEGESRPWSVALVAALRGDRDGALEWLERAVEAGRLDFRWDRLDPAFTTLRGDPHFDALMKRMSYRIETMRAEVVTEVAAAQRTSALDE